MADEQQLPEDILSSVETESEGTVVSRRRTRKVQKRESSKVLFFMAVFIIVIILAGLAWIFFPSILSFMEVEEQAPVVVEEVPIPSVGTERGTQEIDTDRDGLSDIQEQGLGLSINNPDSDDDGLSDRDEVEIYFTDPRVPDTDGDGFLDGDEVRRGFDPNGEGRLDDLSDVLNGGSDGI